MSGVNRISGITVTRHEETHSQSSGAPPFVARPARKNNGFSSSSAGRGEARSSAAYSARRANRQAEYKAGEQTDEGAAAGGTGFLPMRQDAQQNGSGDGDDMSPLEELAAAREARMDLDNLADELAPLAGQSGIFEVILPNGERLGVAIRQSAKETGIFLTPSTPELGERLKGKRTELERRLARHIGRDVSLAVL